MSLVHSYVIPYTENSNFDEISVYDALENYLTAEFLINFEIRVRPQYCCSLLTLPVTPR
jgi:hypothetical protein